MFCNSKTLVTSSRPFLFFITLSIKRAGLKERNRLPFLRSLLKLLISKSLLHALAVLGYLPKFKKGMGLVFTADIHHTFFIKIFLIKYPIKWSSQVSIFGESDLVG